MSRILPGVFLLVLIVLISNTVSVAQVAGSSQLVEKTVISYNDTLHLNFLHDPTLYSQGWDTLPQIKFWKQVLTLTSDTFIINVPSCRQQLQKVCQGNWTQLSDAEKKYIKDSLTCNYNLEENSELFVTKGKSEFYELKKALPEISKAIRVFEQNGVDPWYAQTILLIESPGKAKMKSSVGANGPFQLMKSVARKYGLTVNRKRDDRTNLEKSAKVAAKLLNAGCIPYIKQFLTDLNLPYNETDLWFRLLVLHAYHAGAGNVHGVLNQIQPKVGGIALFNQLWQTEYKHFKNESQNYSQIALASISIFEDLINADGDTVFLVTGDKKFKRYSRSIYKPAETFQYLNGCLTNYENDLVDGTIPYDYFIKKVGKIRKEMKPLVNHISKDAAEYAIYAYPSSENQILAVASRLINKQRNDEAINLIKINLEARPSSSAAYALLSKAYLQNGNKQLATMYSNRSMAIKTGGDMNNKN